MSEALRTAFASFASGNPSGMTSGATINGLAVRVDAPSGAGAASTRLCSVAMPRCPAANAQTLTATALNRTWLEAFSITSSLKEPFVSNADRVSDYRTGGVELQAQSARCTVNIRLIRPARGEGANLHAGR